MKNRKNMTCLAIREQFKKETGNYFVSEKDKHESIAHPDYVDWLEMKIITLNKKLIQIEKEKLDSKIF